MNRMQMQVVINHLETEIANLRKNMCIYAREEMGGIDFDSDKDVIEYFASFAAHHE